MEETEVVRRTVDHLRELGWLVWISNDRIHNELSTEDYPRHFITIGSSIPDIIGFDKEGITYAIEVKGTRDLRKGLGQAMYYSQGATRIYLAAEKKYILRYLRTAKRYNIGIISVGDHVEFEEDVHHMIPVHRSSLEQNLRLMSLNLDDYDNQLLSLTRNQLMNYFAPCLLEQDHMDEDECLKGLESFNVSSSYEIIRGAIILGLFCKERGELHVTNRGRLLRILLSARGVTSLEDLIAVKGMLGNGKHQPVINAYPEIGEFLRMIYLQSQDFQDFLQYIPNQTSKFGHILEDILTENPTFAVLFLTKRKKKDEALMYLKDIESINSENISVFATTYLRSTIYYAFKKHLISMGFIKESSLHYQNQKKYDAYSDMWSLSGNS